MLTGHFDVVNSLKILPNGRLVSGSEVKLRDLEKLVCFNTISFGLSFYQIISLKDFKIIVKFSEHFLIINFEKPIDTVESFNFDEGGGLVILPNENFIYYNYENNYFKMISIN